ncbi:MAG: 50S ribosomal protein L10 [Promethearchaeota archaeon]|nr:MAG: 50S ribosomal protein L10 [Candidatus Lokiarchaeota archaeon]
MMSEKTIPRWKIEEVNKLLELFKEYDNVIIIMVSNINDKQVQSMRKRLRGDAVIKMAKKSLLERAIKKYKEESGKENLDKLAQNIPGQSSLVFTDMDPLELKRIFIENKWMVPARPEEVTPVDIVVPAGDTGLPTGQVISELNMTLRLPTMIKNDTIWIREDKVTHKAGETVSVKEAAVLKKLGIEPIESILNIHSAWADGDIIPQEVIYMDLEQFREDLASCYATARTLAIELEILDKETIEPLMAKAFQGAKSLLFEMPIIDDSMIDGYIQKAESNAIAINAIILGKVVQAPKEAPKEKQKEKPKEEEEEKEEETPGIGGLFG